ncbi:hypothetical protein PMAYCL1PPCAC_21698, partial [Pristionchus mayeri]
NCLASTMCCLTDGELWDRKDRRIEKGELIGRGFFGDVFKGKLNGKVVSIKTPRFIEASEFMEEAEITRHCNHLNVLKTVAAKGGSSSPSL